MNPLKLPEEVTAEELAALGLADPARARRLLLGLAGQGVTDDVVAALLPSLFEALRRSPDPDRALTSFARWTEAVTSRYTHFQYLLGHPIALEIFFNVCGVSQFFSDILIRNPEYFEILANPGVRGGSKSAAALYRELSAFVDAIVRTELKLEAMRRFKQREILRIGTRDILGLADLATTAREFSNLADACVQKCCEIGAAELAQKYAVPIAAGDAPESEAIPLAVIGMGKLGGQELNYSSDIDLMFVCPDEEGAKESQVASRKSQEEGGEAGVASGKSQVASEDTPNPALSPDSRLTTHDSRLSPLEYAHKLAEFVINALSKNMQNGHLFRVDVRLRPEGRFGALVRTLSSYRTYYESWAEPWERQALLKARHVAGDTRLGAAFQEMITPFVYRRSVTSDFVEAIRHNKERIEKKADLEEQARTNVKIGYGGIRDIEFTAQLLQLERGGRDPRLRTPNTLQALARLRAAGALTAMEAEELAEDYVFLRTVEHRLQILYERQTQRLPTEPAERRLLARRLGYADAAAFDADYARRTARVRAHCERLFYGEHHAEDSALGDLWRDLLANVEAPRAREEIVALLREAGFQEPERAYADLKTAAFGGDYGLAQPEARQAFLDIGALLAAACAHSGDPDAALRGIETLAAAVPNRAPLYRMLLSSEEMLDRFCRLAAGSLPLIQSLARHLQWLDLLVSEEIIDPTPKTADQVRAELAERGLLEEIRPEDTGYWDGLALYIQRERLRIGARDLWGEVLALTAAGELAALADAVLESLLARAAAVVQARYPGAPALATLESAAVIGLGKLGGREPGYGSDWDILLVYEESRVESRESKEAVASRKSQVGIMETHDSRRTTPDSLSPDDPTPAEVMNALAEVLLASGQELRARGAPVEIDARLRPEGRFGALARTVAEYRDYYRNAAQTWERQVLTKARPVAGNAQTGRVYMRAVHEALYAAPLPPEAQQEVRHMKRRMESERLKVDRRHTDLKLGYGGMSDIEFTAQLQQLRAGARFPQARVSGTVEALHALGAVGAIPAPDAARLAETYAVWTALRGRLSLYGGLSADVLPADTRRLRALAIGMGAVDAGGRRAEELFREQFAARMAETRAVVERLFYES